MAFQAIVERSSSRSQRIVQTVPTEEPLSDFEPHEALPPQTLRFKGLLVACGLLALVVGCAWLGLGRARACSKDLGAGWAEQKVELDGEGQMEVVSRKLNSVSSKSVAQKMVEKATKMAREAPHLKQKHATGEQRAATPAPRLLPNSFVQPPKIGVEAGTAQCIFNVMEAMSMVIGLGDDINAMVRDCPEPRGADSQVACQVDAGIMVAYVGTVAAKLALAASNCAETANIDAVCAAGVTGIVGALGELAGAASLAGPVCSDHPPTLPTTKISEFGDQTLGGHFTGRRLLIGEGPVGNGVQCGVDVSVVVENLANFGLALNQAVNSANCEPDKWDGNEGLIRSLCTVDIGGAIAYFGQAITFIEISVLNCRDFLDIKALCGASIAGIATSAAAIAPYGAAIHAGCALNDLAKSATAPKPEEPEEEISPEALDKAMALLKKAEEMAKKETEAEEATAGPNEAEEEAEEATAPNEAEEEAEEAAAPNKAEEDAEEATAGPAEAKKEAEKGRGRGFGRGRRWGRRLDDHADPLTHMNEVMRALRETMAELGQDPASIPSIRDQNTASEADLRKLVNLMEPAVMESAALRGAGPFEQECK